MAKLVSTVRRAISTLKGRAALAKSKMAFAREFPEVESIDVHDLELARAARVLSEVVAPERGQKKVPRTQPAAKRIAKAPKQHRPKVKRGQKHR